MSFFANINSKITLRYNIRQSIQDHLMWMDIADKGNESLVPKVLEKDGLWKGKKGLYFPLSIFTTKKYDTVMVYSESHQSSTRI